MDWFAKCSPGQSLRTRTGFSLDPGGGGLVGFNGVLLFFLSLGFLVREGGSGVDFAAFLLVVGILGPGVGHVEDGEGEALLDLGEFLEGEGAVVKLAVGEAFFKKGVYQFLEALCVDLWKGATGGLDGIGKEYDGALLELGLGPGVAVCGLVDLLILSIPVSFVFIFILSVFILGLFLRLVVEVLYEACAVVLTDDVDEQLWELVLLGQFDSFGYVAFDD